MALPDPILLFVLKSHAKVANLDFEARVPVPFSIFPSTYRDSESQTAVQTHEEVDIKLHQKQEPAGRQDQYSSYSAHVDIPPRGEHREHREHRFSEEEVRFSEERHRRSGFQQEQFVKEDFRPGRTEYTDTRIEIDTHQRPYSSPIDVAEREYRERFRPVYHTTVDAPTRPQYQTEDVRVNQYTVEERPVQTSVHQQVKFSEETVEPARFSQAQQKSKMGYYDEDGMLAVCHPVHNCGISKVVANDNASGHYHSFRQGIHKLADKIVHPHHHHDHVDVDIKEDIRVTETRPRVVPSGGSYVPNTVTIPCHHIRLGDFLMLQGRPCQVIRISTSNATGQYRYLGVDLFTKQLHEESSFVSNPAPSVIVQTMLGPVFKQYRVLDMQGGHIVAMTETGDVKQNLPVIDQSNLWSRLSTAFESGRGSVRVLVLNDNGRELAVDMKVIHGSRL
ncbi:woronin body major protein [Metarhizium acridum CQMa 102]|uniref:Woronin body major protein n=1 Tax=Metarhizium acridum (strain CQMa 102) TaxID=655827 RepID=E9EET1_METAQ|nr:woronin body major protein [Metarhizium acridum CQMa 102]EFY85599.1 woronin body major protein [Metarhizium acridum CQMa 102]